MLLKFVKTFWFMTGVSIAMFILLIVIYGIIRFMYGIDDIQAEDLPNGLENSFDMALKIILIFFNISEILAICATVTWAVRTVFFEIWS